MGLPEDSGKEHTMKQRRGHLQEASGYWKGEGVKEFLKFMIQTLLKYLNCSSKRKFPLNLLRLSNP